jgi:hypothetical protein
VCAFLRFIFVLFEKSNSGKSVGVGVSGVISRWSVVSRKDGLRGSMKVIKRSNSLLDLIYMRAHSTCSTFGHTTGRRRKMVSSSCSWASELTQ